jgi:hypothetical protein
LRKRPEWERQSLTEADKAEETTMMRKIPSLAKSGNTIPTTRRKTVVAAAAGAAFRHIERKAGTTGGGKKGSTQRRKEPGLAKGQRYRHRIAAAAGLAFAAARNCTNIGRA